MSEPSVRQILEDLQSSCLREDLFKVEQWQWQESLQIWLYNIAWLQVSGMVLWRDENRGVPLVLVSRQQSSAWTYLLAAAPTTSYLHPPPAAKRNWVLFCFVFFHSTSRRFYLLFSFGHFMLWCLLCVESQRFNCVIVEIYIVPKTNRLLSCDTLSYLIADSRGRRLFIIH